jgi:hypothetical protein
MYFAGYLFCTLVGRQATDYDRNRSEGRQKLKSMRCSGHAYSRSWPGGLTTTLMVQELTVLWPVAPPFPYQDGLPQTWIDCLK